MDEYVNVVDIDKIVNERKLIPNAFHLYKNYKEKLFGK